MKFYFIKQLKQPHMVKMLNKFNVNTYDVSDYDDGVGYLIIDTDLIHSNELQPIIQKYSIYENLFIIINDANEAFPFKNRLLYWIENYLDIFNISRNRIIYSYNNSTNIGIKRYKNIGINTIYFPSFFLENSIGPSSDVVTSIEKSTKKTHDFSLFVRNGKPHKKKALLYTIENEYDCLSTYQLNRDFECSIISKLEEDTHGAHLAPINYFKSKVDILIESEYVSYVFDEDNPIDNNFDTMLHLSEKIWRVVSWGIPFVVVGQKHTLKHLNEIGFKTFDSLIDESYDSMDDTERMYESIKQAKELLKFYNTPKLNSILEYNKTLYLNNDFKKQKLQEFFINPLKNYIKDLV